MSNIATHRLQIEYQEMITSDEFISKAFTVELVNDSLFNMRATIKGPPDTPYSNGCFLIEFKIDQQYPYIPPKVKFLTHIWHPNISSVTGYICLDILGKEWVAAITIRIILLSLQSLLQNPEPNDPQDSVVAAQYKSKRKLFWLTASYWTAVYACKDESFRQSFVEFEEKLKKLQNMTKSFNLTQDQLIVALSANNWNIQMALDSLK